MLGHLEVLILSIAFVLWWFVRRLDVRVKLLIRTQLLCAWSVEVMGEDVARTMGSNLWLYNTYILLDLTLTGLVVRSLVMTRSTVALGMTIPWLICVCLESNWGRSSQELFSVTFIVGAFSLSAGILYVLFSRVLSEDPDQPFYREPEFVLLLAQLIYFTGMIPYNGLMNFLNNRHSELSEKLVDINLVIASTRYALVGLVALRLVQGRK